MKLPAKLKSPILCMSAAPEALWILSTRGEVFVRSGITAEIEEGESWQQLDLSQLAKDGGGAQLQSLSVGSDVAWATDADGKVWMRLGPVSAASVADGQAVPVWIPVDGSGGEGGRPFKFAKVTASTSMHIVWAVDFEGRVFVRDGIFPDFRLGIDWVPVPGPDGDEAVVSVSASDSSVWVLTASGRAFSRAGITPTNFIGDYWRQSPPVPPTTAKSHPEGAPGTSSSTSHTSSVLTLLSATVCDSVYAVDSSGTTVELREESVSLSHPKVSRYCTSPDGAPPKIADESVENGWTVVV